QANCRIGQTKLEEPLCSVMRAHVAHRIQHLLWTEQTHGECIRTSFDFQSRFSQVSRQQCKRLGLVPVEQHMTKLMSETETPDQGVLVLSLSIQHDGWRASRITERHPRRSMRTELRIQHDDRRKIVLHEVAHRWNRSASSHIQQPAKERRLVRTLTVWGSL